MVQRPITSPNSVGDYAVVPLSTPASKSYPVRTQHYLYIRPNAPKLPTPTSPRELFLINIPVDASQSHIRALFSQHLGGFRIDNVNFFTSAMSSDATSQPPTKKRKRRGGALTTAGSTDGWPTMSEPPLHLSGDSCIVSFVDEASAQGAMKAIRLSSRSNTEILWRAEPFGSARYARIHAQRYPDPAVLQDSVDNFMGAFNEAEAERARVAARARQMPDEDGFVTVTRGGRNNAARAAEVQAKLERQKEKHKGREDFYRFQTRERRKDEAKKLARGFEEERRRVQEMRGKRKYRPE